MATIQKDLLNMIITLTPKKKENLEIELEELKDIHIDKMWTPLHTLPTKTIATANSIFGKVS